MSQQFKELVQVTDALYQVELAKVQKIAAEEARLRQALADLDSQARDAMNAAQDDMMAVRALGADLLWRQWVGRARAALQMQLAQVLVRKNEAMVKLRRAFGKTTVAQDLLEQELHKVAKEREAKRIVTDLEQLAQ
ncbi:hypothetical protein DI396_10370 [Litorivita pollutaquae]|uniref:Flagellar FliJ protein n=1 Tax=Litorivita pollutaquae TaxID=2200892 RepID=A0A2V4ML29_9RHOB|nr:hypothetical protein [Litorivita pollutaquae]PYC47365.1 hypothetical protein DI396_10370 [Litorivita pollutaquae]